MSNLDIIRAWKDEEYRLSLSEADLACLPAHPSVGIELSDGALEQAAGGRPRDTTIGCGPSRDWCPPMTAYPVCTYDAVCKP